MIKPTAEIFEALLQEGPPRQPVTRGLRAMHECGASTMAQDEEALVISGLSKEAVEMGAVDRSVALGEIAGFIERYGTGR
jgi:two-component system, chemotaxis family, protein-glutamate methylesterase/glutaminase